MPYQVRFINRSVTCVVTMRWVVAWLGNGFGCSMKDERTCTMMREVDLHLWFIMIWRVRSTKGCETTDVSQFLICPCTFLRFQGLYSMTLSVVIWVIGKCVHDGCLRCSQRSTKNSVLHVLWHFCYTITRKETACWAILWQETGHRCPISHLNQNSIPCTGSILARRKRKSSNRRLQQGTEPFSGQNRRRHNLIENLRTRIVDYGHIWYQQALENSANHFNSFLNKGKLR